MSIFLANMSPKGAILANIYIYIYYVVSKLKYCNSSSAGFRLNVQTKNCLNSSDCRSNIDRTFAGAWATYRWPVYELCYLKIRHWKIAIITNVGRPIPLRWNPQWSSRHRPSFTYSPMYTTMATAGRCHFVTFYWINASGRWSLEGHLIHGLS